MPRKGEREYLTNRKFNRLTVLGFYGVSNNRKQIWHCVCDCGKETYVQSTKLKNGSTKSCGCYTRDRIGNVNKKTGLSNTPLYRTYRNMINRCYWKKSDMYSIYGERGITVCDDWLGEKGFENFYYWSMNNGYSEKLSIDRIDNNIGYSPDNCRWVDSFVQANNRRNNHYIKINGEIDTVVNMARKYNISYWNLLHYSKGEKNTMYSDLRIEVAYGL